MARNINAPASLIGVYRSSKVLLIFCELGVLLLIALGVYLIYSSINNQMVTDWMTFILGLVTAIVFSVALYSCIHTRVIID